MANSSTITEADKMRRREAIDFAAASIGLDGFTITPEHAALAQLYANGEIEFEELLNHQRASTEAEQTQPPADQRT